MAMFRMSTIAAAMLFSAGSVRGQDAGAPGVCACQLAFHIASPADVINIAVPTEALSMDLLKNASSLVSATYNGEGCPAQADLFQTRFTAAAVEIAGPSFDKVMLSMAHSRVQNDVVAIGYEERNGNAVITLAPKQVASVSVAELLGALRDVSVPVSAEHALLVANGRRVVTVTLTDDKGCQSAPASLTVHVSGGGAWWASSASSATLSAAVLAGAALVAALM